MQIRDRTVPGAITRPQSQFAIGIKARKPSSDYEGRPYYANQNIDISISARYAQPIPCGELVVRAKPVLVLRDIDPLFGLWPSPAVLHELGVPSQRTVSTFFRVRKHTQAIGHAHNYTNQCMLVSVGDRQLWQLHGHR